VRAEKPREIAAEILLQRKKGEYIETLLDSALAKTALKTEDRRFLQELVYGVVRWEMTLDWLIARKTGGKPQKEMVQNLLRLALYQMFWLDRVPSYAAVNETVEICKANGLEPQAKFINAVLRGFGREEQLTRQHLVELKTSRPAIGYSHPEWLLRRWEKEWGSERARRLMEWNNSPPPTFARRNSLKTTGTALMEVWNAEGVAFEAVQHPWVSDGIAYRLTSHPALSTLQSFQDGLFYVQDPSTLLAPALLEPKRGEVVLDLCAAPGGKTTFIAQLMDDQGRIQAEDLDSDRLRLVQENANRLGATSIITGGTAGEIPAQFDRILVDAPCSNTGVMRRRVELRWRLKPEEIARMAGTQANLLAAAAKRIRAGGVLVYSTCSLERDENQAVVGKFLALNPSFRLEKEVVLTPMTHGVDGAYCARMIRLV
jgi:16S rRNA (cytosine967-C5)-methyltransferase